MMCYSGIACPHVVTHALRLRWMACFQVHNADRETVPHQVVRGWVYCTSEVLGGSTPRDTGAHSLSTSRVRVVVNY